MLLKKESLLVGKKDYVGEKVLLIIVAGCILPLFPNTGFSTLSPIGEKIKKEMLIKISSPLGEVPKEMG